MMESNIAKGKLFLIPITLGDFETSSKVLPAHNMEIIYGLREFVVEEVRTARRFLSHIGHPGPIDQLIFHELNKHTKTIEVTQYLKSLKMGGDIGLMSEAGTPCVADPGAKVVAMAHESDFQVIPMVGPNSILLALMASGFNGQYFVFHGYLPIDKSALQKKIKEMETQVYRNNQTQIFIETPYRNNAMFELLLGTCQPSTKLCVATNVTLDSEQVTTKNMIGWKKEKPDLHKKPTVFLLYK